MKIRHTNYFDYGMTVVYDDILKIENYETSNKSPYFLIKAGFSFFDSVKEKPNKKQGVKLAISGKTRAGIFAIPRLDSNPAFIKVYLGQTLEDAIHSYFKNKIRSELTDDMKTRIEAIRKFDFYESPLRREIGYLYHFGIGTIPFKLLLRIITYEMEKFNEK